MQYIKFCNNPRCEAPQRAFVTTMPQASFCDGKCRSKYDYAARTGRLSAGYERVDRFFEFAELEQATLDYLGVTAPENEPSGLPSAVATASAGDLSEDQINAIANRIADIILAKMPVTQTVAQPVTMRKITTTEEITFSAPPNGDEDFDFEVKTAKPDPTYDPMALHKQLLGHIGKQQMNWDKVPLARISDRND